MAVTVGQKILENISIIAVSQTWEGNAQSQIISHRNKIRIGDRNCGTFDSA